LKKRNNRTQELSLAAKGRGVGGEFPGGGFCEIGSIPSCTREERAVSEIRDLGGGSYSRLAAKRGRRAMTTQERLFPRKISKPEGRRHLRMIKASERLIRGLGGKTLSLGGLSNPLTDVKGGGPSRKRGEGKICGRAFVQSLKYRKGHHVVPWSNWDLHHVVKRC